MRACVEREILHRFAADTASASERLSGITRRGQVLAYTYDRFGRVLQDGALTYTWDKNGNRKTITYPEAITATYTHDFADREATLTVQVGANPPLQHPPDWDSQNCDLENCVLDRYRYWEKTGYPYYSDGFVTGPNSNTFANNILTGCGAQKIHWPEGVTPFRY